MQGRRSVYFDAFFLMIYSEPDMTLKAHLKAITYNYVVNRRSILSGDLYIP
ncbi:hypothetical protein D3C72_670810 [compost metagenome]